VVVTYLSEKSGIVGMGGVIYDTTTTKSSNTAYIATFLATLELRDRLNTYFVEIIAITIALRNLLVLPFTNRVIVILLSNLSALLALNSLRQ
jgi:hypothetical protein